MWKKGRELGIDKSQDQKKIREVALCAVLPLLPRTDVIDGWKYITRQETEDSDVLKFRNYMVNEWLKPEYIDKWCVFGERHRTTNYLEGWHHKLNAAVGKKKPNIMHFLNELEKDSAFNEVRCIQIKSGAKRLKNRMKKTILNDEFIDAAQLELLNSKSMSVGHFLEMMRH